MRSLMFAATITALLGLVAVARANAEEPATPQSAEPAPSAASADGHTDQAPAQGGEKWRYRQHQGMWWYWLPSEKWVYWSDGKWVNYDPETYAQLRASRRNRVYSYRGSQSGYPELGQWGPVRYNNYGQREYPYSRRNFGIRQLGPVPAMGGVRSLPGWGAER